MKAYPVPCGPAVNESERKAINQLKTRLIFAPGDDEWLLLTNLTFSATHRFQSDEIDIVAIGPPGVRVIEVKHWTAAWVKRHPGIVEQEADRVTNKARKIGTTLRRRVPNLPRVDGAFLVTETATKVKELEGREPVRGVSFHTFKTWCGALGLDSPKVLSLQQIRALGRSLEPRSTVALDGTLKRLAGYTRLELRTPPDERFHRIYRATHASRQDRVLLHLYDLSASDGSKAGERAEREWKSLHRLQRHGWAPRIVDSFQDAPGYTDEIKFFTVADPAAPTIEERAADESWDTNARLSFARGAVRALVEFHEAGTDGDEPMIHRNLTPDTILVKHDNSPILTGFEHTRIPAEISVASAAPGRNRDAAASPEVRAQGRGAADHRSDIYSLCASLTVLLKDRQDEDSAKILGALDRGMADDPVARSSLAELEKSLSERLGDPIAGPPPPPARFWTEDQVVPFRGQSYRIVSRLGSGGVGTTFKVVKIDRETGGDLGTYVAKVVRDEETGRRVPRAYELAHSHLRHSALSTIFEVAPEWRDNQFVALMTWIEGEPLSEYSGVLPILAEDLQEESAEALAVRWLWTGCEALGVLHDNGLVHGDVSPRNLIVSGADLVLTDYDFVRRIGDPMAVPGTVAYCSPSCLEGRDAAPSDDFYALAASFFQVLFEKEPFRYDGDYAKERGLNWSGVERGEYPVLATFLDQATHPDREKCFATAAEALAALSPPRRVEGGVEEGAEAGRTDAARPRYEGDEGAERRDNEVEREHGGEGVPPRRDGERTERRENEVEWLKSLLQSYPGSRWGNRETRGLDSEFAADTYVETDLEQALYRDIVERRVRLVVLCGNAGDGKTALLQHLAQRLGLGDRTSATRILEGRLDDGLAVRMNLDGSASWQGKSADKLLDEFLAPFQDDPPSQDVVHLLAINDGRLLEWIEGTEKRRGQTQLTKDLYERLGQEASSPDSPIRFISLNQRSLVGSITPDEKRIDTSFLDRLVDSLYGGEQTADIWTPCRTCSAQERCEVLRATRTFGPGGLADEAVRHRARQRLFEALQAVHLRGETHITVRELRGALVYILFGVHFCRDYHRSDADSGSPAPQPYWERAFSPEASGRQGEVLWELVRFDPALEAHPQIDRRMLHPPSMDGDDGLPRYEGLSLEAARRRAWFEWPEEEMGLLTGDPHALDLAQGRHLREFRELAIDDEAGGKRDRLVERLCAGISRLEALPPKALDRPRAVPLKITPRTPTETAFWVEKSVSDFRLAVDPRGGEGLGWLHREASLVYRYRDGREERLRLGAELFHLLLELSEGYQLGDVATDDTFAHLSIFVQRLVQEDDRRMFAWNPMCEGEIFEILARIDDSGSDPRQRMSIAPRQRPVEPHAE